MGSPKSLTVPASRLLSYLPSLSSQAYASRGLFGCHATVKVGDSHWISQSFSPTAITHNNKHEDAGKTQFKLLWSFQNVSAHLSLLQRCQWNGPQRLTPAFYHHDWNWASAQASLVYGIQNKNMTLYNI